MMRLFAGVAVLLAMGLQTPACAETPHPISGTANDYDPLLELIGDARIVMLGEATHGSREFYRERARITRRLVEEKGFDAVVLEAAWEPARRLDAYVRSTGGDKAADTALAGFTRFPRWMWRNVEMRDLLESLRTLNQARSERIAPLRIYGMDLYSVPESADAVVHHVARRSIAAAAQARQRYACFDSYLPEPMLYGHAVAAGTQVSCAAGAQQQLAEMETAPGDEDSFAAWQSARVASNGEDYYRALYQADVPSWNLRERHMADTLMQILDHLEQQRGRPARIVVWAHNTHQGDARATDQAAVGEVSLGQLMRERYGESVVLVGFTTHHGWVRAASDWGERDRIRKLRPAKKSGWSGYLHALRPSGVDNFLLILRGAADVAAADECRLERAVGVAYLPHDKNNSHYFFSRLRQQFDAVIHIDVTHAVIPLE